jgi:CheY-like chemotaxis protein
VQFWVVTTMTDTMPDLIDDPKGEALNHVLRRGFRATSGWGALYFLHTGDPLPPSVILDAVTPVLSDMPSHVYQLRNGDFIVTWKGAQKATLAQLTERLYTALPGEPDRQRYYDLQAQGDQLRLFWTGRLQHADRMEKAARPAAAPAEVRQADSDQLYQFQKAAATRAQRTNPRTLLLTDNHYSGKLLISLIGVKYKTFTAQSFDQAVALFCRHAPDIVLLDLQDHPASADGIIKALRAIDPHVFIAMVAVTSDMQASERPVDAFLVKPFTTAKLHAIIDRVRGTRR